jgi:membrane protein
MNKWLQKIQNLPIVKWSKRVVVPGFDGIPIYDVTVFFVKGLMKGALNTRATSLSFQFFLSLFPAIIFLFTLIPFIPIDNFQESLMELIKDLLPHSAYDLTAATLDDIINRQRGGLLSLVFLVVLYLATNGIDAMLEAFSESIHIERKRNYFHQKWVAFLILLLLTVLLIFGIGLTIFSSFVLDYLIEIGNISGVYLLQISRWLIMLSMFYFAISFLYYYGNAKRETWKFFSAGSSFATVMSILLSWAFSWYVNNLAMYNTLYGSIGTLIVILLWIYFNSFVILIGFELNASIQKAGSNLNLS